MSDLLRMDYINSLPQPFLATMVGGGWEFEVYDIDVETGLLRLNVMGKLQVSDIAEIRHFTDMEGVRHDPETFYSDYIAQEGET